MANPNVTYTFVATTTISAGQVNQNFTDIINSLIDGTKSISIDVLGVGGAATITGLLTANGGLTVSGATTLGGAVTVNESGADVDFRIESDTLEYNFFLQGSDGFIGINNATPTSHLHIKALDSTVGINLDTQDDGALSLPMLRFSKNGVFKYGYTVSANEYILGDYNDNYRMSLTASLTSFNSSGADIDFSIVSALSSSAFYFQGSDGFIGLGTSEPSTLLHLANGAPYLTLHNTTEEDTDAGRESYIAFRGEQSGGEASTLAKILAQHDGTSDDQKGELFFYCNDGDDNDSPIEIMHLSSSSVIINESGADIDFRVEASGVANAFFVQGSDGNVGIGTSSPGTYLQVGNSSTGVAWRGQIYVSGNNTSNDGIYLNNGGSTFAWFAPIDRNLVTYATLGSRGPGTGTHGGFRFTSASYNGATYDYADRMTIDSSGNVGIGETSPDYKLDVNGSFGFTPGSSVTPADNGDVVFELTNNTTLTIKAKGSDGTVRTATVTLS